MGRPPAPRFGRQRLLLLPPSLPSLPPPLPLLLAVAWSHGLWRAWLHAVLRTASYSCCPTSSLPCNAGGASTLLAGVGAAAPCVTAASGTSSSSSGSSGQRHRGRWCASRWRCRRCARDVRAGSPPPRPQQQPRLRQRSRRERRCADGHHRYGHMAQGDGGGISVSAVQATGVGLMWPSHLSQTVYLTASSTTSISELDRLNQRARSPRHCTAAPRGERESLHHDGPCGHVHPRRLAPVCALMVDPVCPPDLLYPPPPTPPPPRAPAASTNTIHTGWR